MAVHLLIFAVSEPNAAQAPRAASFHCASCGMGRAVLAVIGMGTPHAGEFSEAWLCRERSTGLRVALIPLVLVVMNVAYALAAYPAGAASDRHGRQRMLLVGMLLLIAADLVLAFSQGLWGVGTGVALWGLHMAFTQGLFAAWVADTAPTALRGTAFGMYNLVTGVPCCWRAWWQGYCGIRSARVRRSSQERRSQGARWAGCW